MQANWVTYVRVSTDEQANHGASLEAQLASCKTLAQLRGFTVSHHIEDAGISGATLNRPGINQLLDLARRGLIKGVIVYKLDRLTRSLKDLLSLLHDHFAPLGVEIASVHEQLDTSTGIGRFAMQLMGSLAELERAQISERVRHVQNHKRSQGAFIGGAVPVGLRVRKDGANSFLEADPLWAPVIATAFAMVLDGKALSDVAEHFTEKKVPNRSGKPWAVNALSYIFKNENYVGHIVDRETFDHVRATLGTRFSPQTARLGLKPSNILKINPTTDRTWRLQGIAHCALCGSSLAGSNSRSQNETLHYYLRCTGRLNRGKDFCAAPDLPAEQCEDMVIQAIMRAIESEDVTQALTNEQTNHLATLGPFKEAQAALRMRRDEVSSQIENLIDLVASGGLPGQAVAPRLAKLQTEANTLDTELATGEARMAASNLGALEVQALTEALRRNLTGFPEWPKEEQKTVIQGLARKVEVAAGQPLKLTLLVPSVVRRCVLEWLRSPAHLRTGIEACFSYPWIETRGPKGRKLLGLTTYDRGSPKATEGPQRNSAPESP